MDIFINQTHLDFKVIGGVIDLFVFTGPTPEETIQQYQEVIGKPILPSYWSLGFHHCSKI
jgi:alpha-glucosidase (family GH31 glycosyl hydrolase)